MALTIETFSNVKGGNSFYKAVSHPLAAPKVVALKKKLAAAGPVTVVPLLMFNEGVRRLNLATVGFLQYVTPTGHFLLAVTVFGEPLDGTRLVSFAFIWTALALYTFDLQHRLRRFPR